MKGLGAFLLLTWRLHARNRLALVYGYVFPLVFLAAYGALYRHETGALRGHFGELLTVTILGGACFGLPTSLVAEREQGIWRRYRLLPVPGWSLLATTAVARFVLLLTAGALQGVVAAAIFGLDAPADPLRLLLAFSAVSWTFIGIGLLMAAVADNVVAVQALGQCIFLPLLILGGVAVPVAALPAWAEVLSRYLPGRYAVEALQAAMDGRSGLSGAVWIVLLATALVAGGTGGALFRWEAGKPSGSRRGRWLILTSGALAVGAIGGWGASRTFDRAASVATAVPPAAVSGADARWRSITPADVERLDFSLPPDDGVVAPMDGPHEAEGALQAQLQQIEQELPAWAVAKDRDALQQVRYLLCVPAVPDVLQQPAERYLGMLVFHHLLRTYPPQELVQMLTYIALHPGAGRVALSVEELGLRGRADDEAQVRERATIYARKYLVRLTGRTSSP